MGVHTVEVSPDVLFVVAVTREAAARARLALQLPGEAMLLLVPDYQTALSAFGSGLLGPHAGQPGDAGPVRTVIRVGALEVDSVRQQVTWNGSPLALTRQERGILGCLAETPAGVWSHERLYREVWREAWLGDATVLHAAVKRLRHKLREAGVPAFLDSVRGVGFRLRVDQSQRAVAHPSSVLQPDDDNVAKVASTSPPAALQLSGVAAQAGASPSWREPARLHGHYDSTGTQHRVTLPTPSVRPREPGRAIRRHRGTTTIRPG
jgi:two-component system, OmpR family, response regulator MtrA